MHQSIGDVVSRIAASGGGPSALESIDLSFVPDDVASDIYISNALSLADGGGLPTRRNTTVAFSGHDPVVLDFDPPRQKPVQCALKRLIDIAAAGGGLILLLPLFVVVALLIKLTAPGPVFFRQARTGFRNETFQILKFRSMYLDRCDWSGVAQTVQNDPRITPLGRVLRRSNVDELPQLWNVLVGHMSLVGPRPHVPGMLAAGVPYEDLVVGYENRHHMRPGITGLAQVSGFRGPTTDRLVAVRRIERDLDYIRRFSLWLDIQILVRTIWIEVRGGVGY